MPESSLVEILFFFFSGFYTGKYIILRLIFLRSNCNIMVASLFLSWLFF